MEDWYNSLLKYFNSLKLNIAKLLVQLIQTENNILANKEINISNLAKGIYIVKITNSDAMAVSKKLIKE